jgi:putative polyhydroxyalkanoate system protein
MNRVHYDAGGVRVSRITIRRPHSLPPRMALSVAKSVAADIEREYGVRSSWKGNTMQFNGSGVRGTLRVAAEEMLLDVQLDFMLFAFRDSIAARIERKFDQVLESRPAKAAKNRS